MAIDILTFAHFAEAQSFIEGLNLSIDNEFSNVYKKDSLILLVTGQGIKNVNRSISEFNNHYSNEINRFFNFGIAGRLDAKLSIDKIYSIKSVCNFDGKSFNLQKENGVDCLTSDQMISDEKNAMELSVLGQVVDMELWAVAVIAAIHNIRLSAYKIISDDASQKIDLKDIKLKAKFYSDSLFNHYIKNYNPK